MDYSLCKSFYRSLYKIRCVEEEITKVYSTDKIKSPVHLSIGQESVSVGVCEALQADDIVFGTYRGHAMYLAKGGNLKKLIAELYGKSTGCAKGIGGSMHLIDTSCGVMGTSAIVGTNIPLSVGYAYGLKYAKKDSVVASFFGDGATDEGVFHESLNYAALKKLPVLFVCENNYYAIHSHYLNRHHSDNICERANSYGMYSERIEDGDVFKIHDFVKHHTEKMRSGDSGPVFLECVTYRCKEHVGPNDDFHFGYRNEQKAIEWKQKDSIRILKNILKDNIVNKIEVEVHDEIQDALNFAEESSFPESEKLFENIFK
jgi:TPP-dependent pyruvate/acetoin dehydrogenase alpha subunit